MHTFIYESFGFLQQQRVDIFSLVQKFFPYRGLHECILRNLFLVGILLISTECGAQDISIYSMRGDQVGPRQNRQSHIPPLACWHPLSIFLAKDALVGSEVNPQTSYCRHLTMDTSKTNGFVWNVALCLSLIECQFYPYQYI